MLKHVTFLGTSAGLPAKGRNVTSQALVLASSRVWLLDCGEATQHQLLQAGTVKRSRIDVILITHLHGDHCLGLPGLLSTLSMGAGRTKPVVLVGPVGLRRYLDAVFSITMTEIAFELDIRELEPGFAGLVDTIDGIGVQAYPLKHLDVNCFGYVLQESERRGKVDKARADALGLEGKQIGALMSKGEVTLADGTVVRMEDVTGPVQRGRKFVLLGDTSDPSSLLEAGRDCDLLVHESTLEAGMEELAGERGHSTSQMAGAFARRIGAATLIITHFSSRYGPRDEDVEALRLNAQEQCPETKVLAASDFFTYEIPA